MAPRKKKEAPAEPLHSCGNCRHFHERKEASRCRRFPPKVVYDLTERTSVSEFPIVTVDEVCGEWAPKLNS
ncbi:hypothetical protein [Ralstonia insidiosa]|uniref:Uncharacterized protein n=1 Tax=Ralstonia insidiosa TaxID=190721 RepID=A0A848NUM0_9RALS|nr:hypothetical protein [Ralstonia insidiosa]NMV36765.1 hypothetical protein [Ralstonia insidiosa]